MDCFFSIVLTCASYIKFYHILFWHNKCLPNIASHVIRLTSLIRNQQSLVVTINLSLKMCIIIILYVFYVDKVLTWHHCLCQTDLPKITQLTTAIANNNISKLDLLIASTFFPVSLERNYICYSKLKCHQSRCSFGP